MPYVQRDNGVIVGVYAVLQFGYAEEFLAEDDQEVMAFFISLTQGSFNNSGVALELRRTKERREYILQLIAEGNTSEALNLIAEIL